MEEDTVSNSEPITIKADEEVFVKPQSPSSHKVPKGIPKIIENVKSSIPVDPNNIYNNPQPSCSKSVKQILLNTIIAKQGIHITQGEKESLNTKEQIRNTQPSTSKKQDVLNNFYLNKYVELYAPDNGPQMHHVKGTILTRPIITKNLPQVFQYLPVHGKPGPNVTLKEFYRNKIREYVGCDLNDEDFSDLENYCSPEHLKTGQELTMDKRVPVLGIGNSNLLHNNFSKPDTAQDPDLITLKKNKMKIEADVKSLYVKKLKYRGVKIIPFPHEENSNDLKADADDVLPGVDEGLEPGVDTLYRVRVYRPYTYCPTKDRFTRTRHSIFSCDIVVSGRHTLTALRDRFVCHNDFDMRVDVSDHPDTLPTTKAKELFPSGFLFINNVFYVDCRKGCVDYSELIRQWALSRGLGDFPRRDMAEVRLSDLVLKLGYPEVYVHQGNCEHVFLFSEVRLLNPSDPLRMSKYPCCTALAQNQTVYCATCAEFSAKWIVVGSDRVPFDPGFFCDTCFKLYMYKDGQKIGQFKAYRYRGNALNFLKP